MIPSGPESSGCAEAWTLVSFDMWYQFTMRFGQRHCPLVELYMWDTRAGHRVCTPRRGQYKQSELGPVGLTQSEYMPQCTGRGVRLLRNRRFPHFRPHRRLSILQLCQFDDSRIVVEGATLVMEREVQINIRFMEKLERKNEPRLREDYYVHGGE